MLLNNTLTLQVSRLRLLGDHVHSTRIAFVEFVMVCFIIFVGDVCVSFLHQVPFYPSTHAFRVCIHAVLASED